LVLWLLLLCVWALLHRVLAVMISHGCVGGQLRRVVAVAL
jgi:hypothetical protein